MNRISPEDEAYFRSIRFIVPKRKPGPDWNLLDDREAVAETCRLGAKLLDDMGQPTDPLAGRIPGDLAPNGADRAKGESK